MDRDYMNYLYQASPEARGIVESDCFDALSRYPRHIYTDTFSHSVRVAVCMAWLSEKTGVSARSAVKVGLLHDLCFVDYTVKNDHPGLYCFYHPEEAAANAKREYGLTPAEEKAIRAHMFPLALHLPTSRLALTLILADKLVATYEVLYGISWIRKMLTCRARKSLAAACARKTAGMEF